MRVSKGFTIVELLIVIVVIAILAAISIVAYNGIQNRGYDTALQSDLSNAAKKLQLYKVSSSTDQYPTSLAAADLAVGKPSYNAYGNHYTPGGSAGYNMLYCRASSSTKFAIIARSKSGNTYAIRDDRSVYQTSQTLTTANTSCPAEDMSTVGAWWAFSDGTWQI